MDQKAHFAALYRDAVCPIAVVDQKMKIIFENAAFEDLMKVFGMGKSAAFFNDALCCKGAECMENRQGATIPLYYEDSSISVMLVPCEYEGEPYLVVQPQQEAGAIKQEEVTRILRNSHDRLLSYLNELYGTAQTLGLETGEGKRIGRNVRKILRMANHLYQILDREGKHSYRVPVNVGSFLSVYMDQFNRVAEQPVMLAPHVKELYGRMMPEDMETVLSILLSNAVRFGGEDIQISLHGTEEHVIITVWDSGDGAAEPDRLFEWGYRTSDKKGRKGLGYSLPLAKSILERQGATIRYCRKNEGTAFEIAIMREQMREGSLAEWKAEEANNSLSQLIIELSDLN